MGEGCGGAGYEVGGFGVGAAEGAVDEFAGGVEDFAFDFFVGRREGVLGVGDGDVGLDVVGWDIGGCAEDESAEGQVVEYFAAVAPDVGGAVFADAFVVEAVDGGDLAGFVVAADEGDAVWVAHFEAEEEQE